ncbi:MAG: SDR family oxidoreductase [Alphaproteobacteria bacterium]
MADGPEKTVIVTGATYGIGRAITLRLAGAGFRVIGCGLEDSQPGSRARAGIGPTRAALSAAGLSAELVEADVTREEDVERVIVAARQGGGAIWALVNNAAVRPAGTITEITPEAWRRALDVNLTGAFLMARAVLDDLRAHHGRIVNIGSGAAWGKPGIAAYGASKAGLYGLTMAMAYDHLAEGVAVNMVIPGPGTASGMLEAMESAGGGNQVPLTVTGRANQPEDTGEMVAYLLSPAAAQISGAVFDVGGFFHQGGAGQPRRPA